MSRELTARLWEVARRTDDAALIGRQADALWGDRVWRDPLIGEGNVSLWWRDPDRQGWLVPEAIVMMDLDFRPPPEPPTTDPQAAEWIAAARARREAEQADRVPPRRRHPARLTLREGQRVVQLTYGEDGWLRETMRSTNDAHQPGVISVLADGTWDDLDGLMGAIGALDPRDEHRVRVWMPVPCPAGPLGAWLRVQRALQERAFAGTLPLDGGWLVADGYRADVVAVGPDFDAAVAAWRARLDDVTPLPPAPPTPKPLPPPEPDHHAEWEDKERGVKVAEFGMTIVFRPRVHLDWPEPDPASTPGVALPMDAAPELPDRWRDANFRLLRLFGEHGDTGWAALRDDGDVGWLVVGEALWDVADPATLDDEIDGLDREARDRFDEEFGHLGLSNPFEAPDRGWHTSQTIRDGDAWKRQGFGAAPVRGTPAGLHLREQVVRCRPALPASTPDNVVRLPRR